MKKADAFFMGSPAPPPLRFAAGEGAETLPNLSPVPPTRNTNYRPNTDNLSPSPVGEGAEPL